MSARFLPGWRPGNVRVCYDPGTIGALIVGAEVGAELIGIGGITIGQVVGYTAITATTVGLSYTAQALAARPQSALSGAASQISIKQAIPPRFRSYGTVKIGGPFAFERVVGGGYGADHNISGPVYQILLQGLGEIDSVIEHWFDNYQALLNGSGNVVGGINFGNGRAFFPIAIVKNKLGTADQTAFTDFVAALTPTYTTEHRWRGVPVTSIYQQNFDFTVDNQRYYPQGPLAYRCVQRAAKLYDPREIGQDADGDPDDPTSANWAWSDNAALVILDFLRHPDGWARRSQRTMLPFAKFNAADWIAFANLCDENVTLKVSGTVKRYRICGSYQMTMPPKDILQGMLNACDGEIFRHGDGTIGIRGGQWTIPDATFVIGDGDILTHSLKSGERKAAACNRINAKYTSPPHDYQTQDMDPLFDDANVDLRGEDLAIDLDFAWVPSHNQSRRLAKIQMAKRNPEWMGTIVTGPRGLLAYNQRIVLITISELLIFNQPFFITKWMPSPTLEKVEIGVSSLNSSAYDFDADLEEGTPPLFTALDDSPAIVVGRHGGASNSDIPIPSNVVALAGHDIDGNLVVSLTWDIVNPNGYTLNYQAFSTETAPVAGEDVPIRVSEVDRAALTDALVDADDYLFKVRAISPGGQPSDFAIVLLIPSADFSHPRNSQYLLLLMMI